MTPRILIVDDDSGVRYTLREILESNGIEAIEAASGAQALALLAKERVDLVLTDLRMPELDGMTLLRRIAELPDPPRTVLITAHGSERDAVQAMKLGALDYFRKPFDLNEILAVVERAVAVVRGRAENEALRAELMLSRHLVFRSEAMCRVALLVARIAPRPVNVLISGPTGTGKERIAEAIVANSTRADRPFLRFNGAALSRELAESELFGHARGAFTGAARARAGLFREAHGGTLFLDEVGELDPLVQAKLLRVLQERVVRPLGEEHEVAVDVRIIAATNRDLLAEVRGGRMREDLYYRLNVVEVALPPLAQRRDDIPALVDHFLRKYADRFATEAPHLSPQTRCALESAPWPGNVRELEHAIERLVALGSDHDPHGNDVTADARLSLKDRVNAYERGLVSEALLRCGGNRSETARQLGIGRVTLLEKVHKYGL